MTTLAHDGRDRVVAKTVTPAGGTAVVTASTWDEVRSGFHDIGKLTRQETDGPNGGARTCHDHDVGGRKVKESWTIPPAAGTACTGSSGESFAVETRYDAAGRLLGNSYPDGDAVGTVASPVTYDAAGRLLAIPGHVTSLAYDAAGRTTLATYANGVTTEFTYSPTRGWLDRVLTARSGTTIDDKLFARDAGGRPSRSSGENSATAERSCAVGLCGSQIEDGSVLAIAAAGPVRGPDRADARAPRRRRPHRPGGGGACARAAASTGVGGGPPAAALAAPVAFPHRGFAALAAGSRNCDPA